MWDKFITLGIVVACIAAVVLTVVAVVRGAVFFIMLVNWLSGG